MSELSSQEFKRSVQSIFIKCGSAVLALVVSIALIYNYADELGGAIVAALHWLVNAVIWLKDVLIAGVRLYEWLPFGLAATMLVVKLWMSCVCASMVKQGLYSPLYAKLDSVNKWMRLISLFSLCLYIPLSSQSLLVAIPTIVYGMFLLCFWLEENSER